MSVETINSKMNALVRAIRKDYADIVLEGSVWIYKYFHIYKCYLCDKEVPQVLHFLLEQEKHATKHFEEYKNLMMFL